MSILEKEENHELRAILASVYYLSNEAKNSKLETVKSILEKALIDIENWITNPNFNSASYISDIANSELYKILTLLNQFSATHKGDLLNIVKSIEFYEKIKINAH